MPKISTNLRHTNVSVFLILYPHILHAQSVEAIGAKSSSCARRTSNTTSSYIQTCVHLYMMHGRVCRNVCTCHVCRQNIKWMSFSAAWAQFYSISTFVAHVETSVKFVQAHRFWVRWVEFTMDWEHSNIIVTMRKFLICSLLKIPDARKSRLYCAAGISLQP